MGEPEVSEHKELRLDQRHLTFFFVGAVIVCAIFFALGFIVGRGQTYEASIKAQSAILDNAGSKLSSVPAADSANGAILPSAGPQGNVNSSGPLGSGTSKPPKDEGVDYRKELDFYNAVKDQKVKENFAPEPKKPPESSQHSAPQPSNALSRSSVEAKAPPGERLMSLQVAALTGARDAENLAKTLRSKGYPVFILRPGADSTDRFIRIQVGPYKGESEALAVKVRLEKDGFKTILKR